MHFLMEDPEKTVFYWRYLGYIDRTELPARTVYQSVFALLFHLLHLDVWDASYM